MGVGNIFSHFSGRESQFCLRDVLRTVQLYRQCGPLPIGHIGGHTLAYFCKLLGFQANKNISLEKSKKLMQECNVSAEGVNERHCVNESAHARAVETVAIQINRIRRQRSVSVDNEH